MTETQTSSKPETLYNILLEGGLRERNEAPISAPDESDEAKYIQKQRAQHILNTMCSPDGEMTLGRSVRIIDTQMQAVRDYTNFPFPKVRDTEEGPQRELTLEERKEWGFKTRTPLVDKQIYVRARAALTQHLLLSTSAYCIPHDTYEIVRDYFWGTTTEANDIRRAQKEVSLEASKFVGENEK